jgi:hypothetical protein
MCLCMRGYRAPVLTHRLHILLDEDRWQRLDREAARRKVPVAAVVREAIDLAFPVSDALARRAAADGILHAEPMAVPDDPAGLKREIDEMRMGGL